MDKAIREGRLNEVKEILCRGDYNVNEVSKVVDLSIIKLLMVNITQVVIACHGVSLLCYCGSAVWLLSPISVLEIS